MSTDERISGFLAAAAHCCHALSLFGTAPRARVRPNHSSPIDPIHHQFAFNLATERISFPIPGNRCRTSSLYNCAVSPALDRRSSFSDHRLTPERFCCISVDSKSSATEPDAPESAKAKVARVSEASEPAMAPVAQMIAPVAQMMEAPEPAKAPLAR